MLNGTTGNIPIMGLPTVAPAIPQSDLSLQMFLTQITAFNGVASNSNKSVKLVFRSIENFQSALPVLAIVWPTVRPNRQKKTKLRTKDIYRIMF